MYSRSVSYNNSTFNKAEKKSRTAIDASADGDFGSALAAVENKRCAPRTFKEIHRAPSAAQQMPDKAILKVDDEKLVVRKDDDFEFAVKAAPKKCPGAPLKAARAAKIVDPSFFAPTTAVAVAAAAASTQPQQEEVAPRRQPRQPRQEQPELSWRSRK
jgi:hypothetical protein